MITQTAAPSRIVMVRLSPHEDLLLGIREAVSEAGIENGAILSGAGSLSAYNAHVVETTNLPPGNAFFYGEGASVIEWADKIRGLLPDEYLDIELSVKTETSRNVKITARGKRYEDMLTRFKI